MKKKSLFGLFVGLAMNALFAQTDFGLKANGLLANDVSQSGYRLSNQRLGFGLGFTSSTKISNILDLDAGIELGYYGMVLNPSAKKPEFAEAYRNQNEMYQLRIPVDVAFNLGKVRPYVGLYYSKMGSFGSVPISITFDEVEQAKISMGYVGVRIGAGVQLSNHIRLTADFGGSFTKYFTNFHSIESDKILGSNPTLRGTQTTLGFNYIFTKKSNHSTTKDL